MMAFNNTQNPFTYTREIIVKKYGSITSLTPHELVSLQNRTHLPNILKTSCHSETGLAVEASDVVSASEKVCHPHTDLLTRAGLTMERMPKHVALLPDGNRRWARSRMLPFDVAFDNFGKCTKQLALNCSKLGIQVLSIFPFSTENWTRPKEEVDIFMGFFEEMIRTDLQELACNGMKITVIGERSRLSTSLQSAISYIEDVTMQNKGMHLLVAFNYGGRYDIIQSCKKIASKVREGVLKVDDVNDNLFQQNLLTSDVKYSNIDLLIRVGGECRLSNFMVWQLAFSELYFSNKFFPDFDEADLLDAIKAFQCRDRRYGGKTFDSHPYEIDS